jgi:tripartite-type tricarboxylate transporter receptor subunit TctC
MTTRRHFTTTLALMSGGGLLPRLARAQSADTVRILVGFPAGGGSDTIARRLAERLQGTLAPTVIVENKPGAGGQISVTTLKNSAPDGTTLLLTVPGPITLSQFTFKSLPYQPDDTVPVSMVSTFAFAFVVGPAVPESVRSLKDYLAWARANPRQAVFGSPAAGATPHLVGSMLAKAAGVELTHVPYRGDAPGIQDLLGGQVPAFSSTLGSFLPHMTSNKLRILAVSGTSRNPIAPDLPTYREQGFPIDNIEWTGIFVPKGTAPATVQRIARAVQAVVANPDFAKFLADLGMTPQSSTPEAFVERVHAETEFWRVEIKRLGFTAQS